LFPARTLKLRPQREVGLLQHVFDVRVVGEQRHRECAQPNLVGREEAHELRDVVRMTRSAGVERPRLTRRFLAEIGHRPASFRRTRPVTGPAPRMTRL
jgi:hypothetical protein